VGRGILKPCGGHLGLLPAVSAADGVPEGTKDTDTSSREARRGSQPGVLGGRQCDADIPSMPAERGAARHGVQRGAGCSEARGALPAEIPAAETALQLVSNRCP